MGKVTGIEVDFKTIIALTNLVLFIIVVPLLKYIWNSHTRAVIDWQKEHDSSAEKSRIERKQEYTEFISEVSSGIKFERQFTYNLYGKHEDSIAELYERSKNVCATQEKLAGKIETQTKLCEERHSRNGDRA